MIELDWRLALAILLGALFLLLRLVSRFAAWRRSRRARSRGRRAVQGESDAELLLQDHGYEILDRQLARSFTVMCDGREESFELRADLLVSREGERFIAEVKTGSLAPSLSTAATRRQLLEYSIAYASPVILLVDVQRERILEVRFPNAGGAAPVDSSLADQGLASAPIHAAAGVE